MDRSLDAEFHRSGIVAMQTRLAVEAFVAIRMICLARLI